MTDEEIADLRAEVDSYKREIERLNGEVASAYGKLHAALSGGYERGLRLRAAWASARMGRAKARKEAADLGATLTLVGQSFSLIGDRAEQAEEERDQALVDLETAKGWRDQLKAERDEYRRANTQLQELASLRAGERDRLKAAIDRVRAVHHLIEWVSLSDVCSRHHWFRTVEPCAENIAVADVCPDCRPRRYMNCVCADDECPVLVALDQPGEAT